MVPEQKNEVEEKGQREQRRSSRVETEARRR